MGYGGADRAVYVRGPYLPDNYFRIFSPGPAILPGLII
jgi:hypothetical protein